MPESLANSLKLNENKNIVIITLVFQNTILASSDEWKSIKKWEKVYSEN